MGIKIKTSVRPPPSEWSISPKKVTTLANKIINWIEELRDTDTHTSSVQSKSCELSSLRYHMGGSSKHKLCWFGRKLFLNCPMLNQLQTGAKSLLVSMENGHPLLPYVHHGYGTKQLINLKRSSRDYFFSCEHQLISTPYRRYLWYVSQIRNPTKSVLWKGKRWFWGSQKFEI